MQNKDIKERRIIKIQYYLSCPIIGCKKEIKGNSKSQVLYNLKEHIKTHNSIKSQKANWKSDCSQKEISVGNVRVIKGELK